ncbi:SMP-30/gluconolactonase/LRE family protein, partial [Streptomyces sp. NPDC054838]
PHAVAAPPPAPPRPATVSAPSALTVADPHIVAHFRFAEGRTPENIALEPDGSANLTFAFARQVARVGKGGGTRVLATLPDEPHPATPLFGAAVTTGIVRTRDGALYVGYDTGTAALTGIWRITPDGSVSRFAALPPDALINGLALDQRHGFLYAADSALGKVWRVSLADRSVRTWASGPQLRPNGFLGANGIKVRDEAVWVSNYDRGTLLRIPVRADGSPGPIATRATGLTGVDDFAFAGHDGTVLAALNPSSELALVRPDGTHDIVLTARDGLSNPTSVAIRHHRVFVPSAAYTTQHDPNLQVARLRGHGANGHELRDPR